MAKQPRKIATHPTDRPSLLKWSGERCPSTYKASETLDRYGFCMIAKVELLDDGQKFAVTITHPDAGLWTEAVYAFVINNEIVRVGSSKGSLRSRMADWSHDVSNALKGNFGSTKAAERDLWREELTLFGSGMVWARRRMAFLSPVSDKPMSGYQGEETSMIQTVISLG
jgi:hypothetical protein